MNIFKKIGQLLFGKKDSLSEPCQKVYSELEKVKKQYTNTDYVTSGYLRTEDATELPSYITSTIMGTSINHETGKPKVRERPIVFFNPEDNKKEIKLNEKKSSEIKKKRGPYKKKKK